MDSYWVDTWISGASLDAGLSPGSIYIISTNPSTVQIGSLAPATGETSITYQWYRKTTVPTPGSYGESLAGGTGLTFTEAGTLEGGTDFYYTRLATDTYGRTGYDYVLLEVNFERGFKLDDWHIYANTKRRYY